MHTVYSLIDPRNQAIKYVGETKDVYSRMRQHSRCAGDNEAKNAWIRELQKEQLMFVMYSLEKVMTSEQALERELFWINKYLAEGIQLFNIVGVEDPIVMPKAGPRKLKPCEMGMHVPVGQMDQFWYCTQDGRVVNLEHSRAADFDAFISKYVKRIVDVNRVNWSLRDRWLVVHFAEKKGIVLDFCESALVR